VFQKTKDQVSISLTRGKGEIDPMKPQGNYEVVPDDIEPLSQIIKDN